MYQHTRRDAAGSAVSSLYPRNWMHMIRGQAAQAPLLLGGLLSEDGARLGSDWGGGKTGNVDAQSAQPAPSEARGGAAKLHWVIECL